MDNEETGANTDTKITPEIIFNIIKKAKLSSKDLNTILNKIYTFLSESSDIINIECQQVDKWHREAKITKDQIQEKKRLPHWIAYYYADKGSMYFSYQNIPSPIYDKEAEYKFFVNFERKFIGIKTPYNVDWIKQIKLINGRAWSKPYWMIPLDQLNQLQMDIKEFWNKNHDAYPPFEFASEVLDWIQKMVGIQNNTMINKIEFTKRINDILM